MMESWIHEEIAMPADNLKPLFRSAFSLEPLLDFWKENVVPMCPKMAEMYADFEKRIEETPGLQGAVTDLSIVDQNRDIIAPLMSVVIPAAAWESEVMGVVTPFDTDPVYVSPRFERLYTDHDGEHKGRFKDDLGESDGGRLLRAYFQIAEKVYGIKPEIEPSIVRIVPDEKTGLDRYFRLVADMQFVEVATVGKAPVLDDESRTAILENMTDVEVLRRYLPPEKFEFRGFVVVRAVEVTESELLSLLERDLIDQESIFSQDGFKRVKNHLKTLFGRPDLIVGMGAIQGDQVLVIGDDSQTHVNCIFANSRHLALADIQGSVWFRAVEKGSLLRIPDMRDIKHPTSAEQHIADMGIRSMLISPLYFQGNILGTLEIMSPKPDDLGPFYQMLTKQITPLFAIAVKRGLDEMNNGVQAIIKEKCTAVHPSVEWRFQEAAVRHMDRLNNGQASELEPIVFKDVVPLFAQTDIRGSSEARNRSIQSDLTEQLSLAGVVMNQAFNVKSWPLIQEYQYRIDNRIEEIGQGLTSDDETTVSEFLIREIEPVFSELVGLGPQVANAVEKYRNALDPNLKVVYRKRKAFEESVSRLNEHLSAFLDKEESNAQSVYPHYFEKHQTDGLDYLIYVGASLRKDGILDSFHAKNLRLWQFMVACGLAREAEKVKPGLAVPLDTCNLILVNQSPLAIRFRYDEKRFDVDGAYDIRHEIVKSRIDKATVSGTRERLTQPGHLAVVYSRQEEGAEIRQHIDFMQHQGCFSSDIEYLNLEDLPGVRGLKAIRVRIDLEAEGRIGLERKSA